MKWLRRLLRPEKPIENLLGFWEDRTRRYGRRAVINLGYIDEEYDAVTAEQRDRLFPLLGEMLTGGERLVLDFGCGAGRFSASLATLANARVVAVDPVQELLELAPAARGVEYRRLADRIPLDDGSADLIWIFSVLGGITRADELRRTVDELGRVLAPGGLVFLVENSSDKPDASYWSYRTPGTYRELLAFADLRHLGDMEEVSDRLSILAGRRDVSAR